MRDRRKEPLMRTRMTLPLWRLIPVLLISSPSVAGAQARVEQGREVLDTVRAMHLMIDFGGEALDPNQLNSLTLAEKLRAKYH